WVAPVAVACWVLAGTCILVALSFARPPSRRAFFVVLGVSFAAMALVATSTFAAPHARRPDTVRSARTLSGAELVTTQTVTSASAHFAATLTRVGTRAVSVPVLVFDAAPRARIEIGTTLAVSGKLQATAPSDEVSYLVFAVGSARVVAPPPWYLAWTNGVRAGLSSASRGLPGDGGSLLPGLAIGDTTAVSPALNAAMKTS